MPKLKKIFILFLLIFVGIFFNQTNRALADKSLSQEEFETTVINGSYTKEDAEKGGVENIIHTLNIATSGPETYALRQAEGRGAIAQTGSLVAYMIGQPPVSIGEYLADIGSNAGLPIKSAYAQGVGWEALRPVLPVWKVFRNVAYLGFIVILVVIGFMIMFGAKIGGQTEVTLQMALPKLIITLLLITFSYAIAGLMIDLIYIAIYLIVGVLYLGGLLTETSRPVNILLTRNPYNFVFFREQGQGFANIFIQAPGEGLQDIVEGILGDWSANSIFSEGIGGLAKLILGIALLFSLFKLFFSLLISYLGIIISVIMAPFSLLFNALPGSSAFGNWLKGLFANIAPFPAVAGMFLLAAILIGPKDKAACNTRWNPWCVQQGVGFYPESENNQNVWVPPMLTLSNQEGGLGEVNAFTGLIAFGIVMMTPQIVSQIKKMLKVEPSGFGGAILGGITGPIAGLGGVAQTGWNMYQNISSIKGNKAEISTFKNLQGFLEKQERK